MKTGLRHTIRLALLLGGLLAAALPLRAQTEPQLTQYWSMPSLYNPAAAGATDYLRLRAGTKMQWVGIENAPMNFFFAGDMPFKINKARLGVGANLEQEAIGLFRNLEVNVQANFRFKLLKGQFSVGVQGGYFTQKFKGSDVVMPEGDDYHQPGEEGIPNVDVTGKTFDLSAGVYYNHKYFHVGLSGLHLLEPSVNLRQEGNESTDAVEFYTKLPRMLYFVAGGNIPIKNTLFEMQPSVLVKSDFTRVYGELTARATYNKLLTFGVAYRWREAISAMVGIELKNFFAGYAYDYPLSAINKGSSGSHELVVGYSMKLDFSQKNKNKHRSIRLM